MGWGVLWYLVVLGVLRVLGLYFPCVLGLERILLLCILCLSVFVGLLELLLILTIPVFFCILANGSIWPPSTSLWFWCCCTGGWLILFLGLNLYRQFRICGSHGIGYYLYFIFLCGTQSFSFFHSFGFFPYMGMVLG